MDIGVNAVMLSPPFCKLSTPEEAVNIMTEAGMRCFILPVKSQIWRINPERLEEATIKKARSLIKSSIKATSLGFCWPNEYGMITQSNEEYGRNLSYAQRLCDAAVMLGMSEIVIGAPGRSVPSSLPYHEGVKLLSRFWAEACQYAEKQGVSFCFEHGSQERCNVGNTTKSLIDLYEAVNSSSFRLIAQIHDMAVNDLDVPEAIMAMGDRIRQVHISDVSGVNPLKPGASTVLPGFGVLNFIEIFRALKDIGYDGGIYIETMLGNEPAMDLKKARRILEEKWQSA